MISRVNKILMVLCLSLVLLSQVGTTALARNWWRYWRRRKWWWS
ncbi:hypothetical protein [Tissierella sp. P1]|nr:hypothetical protein [Tissierella sp. P1]